MIHGGAHCGACFQATVDRRPGWAYDFVARGHAVIVPDWPGVGRSGYIPFQDMTGEKVVEGLSALIQEIGKPLNLLTHSMAGCYGWRLAELHRDLVTTVIGVTPSPPGNIQEPAILIEETSEHVELETFGRRMVVDLTRPNFPSDETIDVKYIGESTFFPRELLSVYKASLLALPPRILVQRRNIHDSQVRLSHPESLKGLRAFIITGTADLDHPRNVDEDIAIWLNQQGALAHYCYLGDLGIVGNGHMLMLEKNSHQIANIMIDWLEAALNLRTVSQT